ncbi:SDR family NAD(P)-dependent oxidoreductase [Rhodococcus sp. 3Y1]
MARAVVVGASRGLGRALIEGLRSDGDEVLGISRRRPDGFDVSEWIEADLTDPVTAANSIDQELVGGVDTLICNVGIWEGDAFTTDYAFAEQSDMEMLEMINANITATILLLKRLIPRMIGRPRPRIILTGSTSGLPRSGRPEVAFGASKFAINGIADALRGLPEGQTRCDCPSSRISQYRRRTRRAPRRRCRQGEDLWSRYMTLWIRCARSRVCRLRRQCGK